MEKVNAELADVQKILMQDFEMIMDRDKNLNAMGAKAADLKQKSANFKARSKEVKWQMILRRYYLIGIAAFVASALIYYFFFMV